MVFSDLEILDKISREEQNVNYLPVKHLKHALDYVLILLYAKHLGETKSSQINLSYNKRY